MLRIEISHDSYVKDAVMRSTRGRQRCVGKLQSSQRQAYLELLAARGIDYFFANGGTDFGPIVEAYAKRMAGELPVPKPVTVPHEITAVAMAHGYTMVTGRPQVVMVHTIAGTANAVGGLINASRTQIPMLFTAGRTPTTESGLKGSRSSAIHWAQGP